MRRGRLIGLIAVVTLAALGYGGYLWWQSLRRVATDDAYVEGNIVIISAKVAGHVAEVHMDDNRAVKAGDLLLRIDPRDYVARRDQARAAVAVALASHQATRSETELTRETTTAQAAEASATLESARVSEQAAESAVLETRATVEAKRAAMAAMTAEVTGAQSTTRQNAREMERMRKLLAGGFVAQRDFDQAEMAAGTSAATLEATQRRLTQAEKEVQQAEAAVASRVLAVSQARQRINEARAALARAESQRRQVTVKEAEMERAEANLSQARADLSFAELQLSHTEVRAPVDGVISKKTVEPGQVVQMGQPLFAIVPLQSVWVVANFKETQLARVKPGMPAQVEIDTFPGRVFNGTVDSLSAGTGARFSLLPPENATGNWVKVVQRIPVKIRLDAREFGNPHTLRAGMSAYVVIHVK
ncbi:MAG TPA: HlyD family secretion protein [Candidatus Dormibacteraeota bacterium]|jgi:membrane fusion protein (multidrug efflux system)|nr:HlyD family secretion protein [Candidatus Dormibacteraeota bacterium]